MRKRKYNKKSIYLIKKVSFGTISMPIDIGIFNIFKTLFYNFILDNSIMFGIVNCKLLNKNLQVVTSKPLNKSLQFVNNKIKSDPLY